MSNEPKVCKAEGCSEELATMASIAAQRCARCVAKERDRKKLRDSAFEEARRQAYEVDVPRLERLVESQKEVIDQLQEELRTTPVGDGEYKALYDESIAREEKTIEEHRAARAELLQANRELTKRINAMRQAHAATCERFRVDLEVAQRKAAKAEHTRDKAQERVKEMARLAMGRPQELILETTQEQPERHLWNALFMHSMQHAKVQRNSEMSADESMRAMVRACCSSADRLYNYVKEARRHGTDNHHNGQGGQRSAAAPGESAAPERPRGDGPLSQAQEGPVGNVEGLHGLAVDGRRRSGQGGQDLAREQEAPAGVPGQDREIGVSPCGIEHRGEVCHKKAGHKSPCTWSVLEAGPEDFGGSDY